MTLATSPHPLTPITTRTTLNPVRLVAGLYGQRELIIQLTKKEIVERYRGSLLGVAWTLISPLVMLLIYTFVFAIILKAKWGTADEASPPTEFALTLLAGLIPFSLFSEVITRAPTLVLNSQNYVKKVVFPLEVLPVVAVCTACFHSLLSMGILLIGILFFLDYISPLIVLLPLAYIPLVLLTVGLAWFLASLGVYLRDLGQITGPVIQALLFLSPVFYPITLVPEPLRPLFYVNPLTTIISGFRRAVLWQDTLPWGAWAAWTGLSAAIALLGLVWFMKTKKGFADVM
jgi:lipopolysaccharide transport system permease protein